MTSGETPQAKATVDSDERRKRQAEAEDLELNSAASHEPLARSFFEAPAIGRIVENDRGQARRHVDKRPPKK